MLLRFLGKNTNHGGSPTLWATDHGYAVQGWKVDGHPNQVEIPHPLLGFLEPGTCLGSLLHDTGHGTFILSGKPITDPEALAQMNIPDHEASVEVPIAQEIRPDATTAR
ncbi:hypothetical protein ACQP0C_37160 [Nocardia sp. CA-129566]|uniref:hypothetical protein n=1 Tax=Nocardia sp. CA-129566 TaxID=3239976 RepID=UPI003D983916